MAHPLVEIHEDTKLKEAAAAIITNGKNILLGKRAPAVRLYPNVWDLFGGHCEKHETPEQALVRELKEELNITVVKYSFLLTLDEMQPELYGEYKYHIFLVTKWEGTMQNVSIQEHSQIKWFKIRDALKLDLPHPKYVPIFKCIQNTTTTNYGENIFMDFD